MRKTMTLRNRFILTSYLSIVCSVVLICAAGYFLLSSNALEYAAESNQTAVTRKNETIEARVWGLETTLRDLIYSQDMQNILKGGGVRQPEGSYENQLAANRVISRAANSLYMIDNIAIFSADGTMMGSMFEFDMNRTAQEYPWYDLVKKSTGSTLWLTDTAKMTRDNYGYHMTMAAVKKIRSVYDSQPGSIGKELGYVYMLLNMDNVLNFVQSEYPGEDRCIFAMTADSRVLGSNDSTMRGQIFEAAAVQHHENNSYITTENGKFLMTSEVSGFSDEIYIVCLSSRQYILKDAYTAIGVCVVVAVVLLIAFWIFSVHNANSLCRPIRLLEEEFEMVERGNFEIGQQNRTNILEIDSLFIRFRVMAERLDKLIKEVYEGKIKEQKLIVEGRQAQLQSLQMQINPHFLYNTLDSINWMALMEGNETVSKMILALGHLFRSNMDREHIFITVRGEIENVKLYMYLEQMRFDGRLEYEVQAPEEVMDAVILKHVLQPLAENSIKHGIEPYDIQGRIRILLEKRGERLSITVSNNGKEMKEETLQELRRLWENIETIGEYHSRKGTGVGMINIMKRLWLCYGKEAELSIISSAEQGTITEIIFPFSTEQT